MGRPIKLVMISIPPMEPNPTLACRFGQLLKALEALGRPSRLIHERRRPAPGASPRGRYARGCVSFQRCAFESGHGNEDEYETFHCVYVRGREYPGDCEASGIGGAFPER